MSQTETEISAKTSLFKCGDGSAAEHCTDPERQRGEARSSKNDEKIWDEENQLGGQSDASEILKRKAGRKR